MTAAIIIIKCLCLKYFITCLLNECINSALTADDCYLLLECICALFYFYNYDLYNTLFSVPFFSAETDRQNAHWEHHSDSHLQSWHKVWILEVPGYIPIRIWFPEKRVHGRKDTMGRRQWRTQQCLLSFGDWFLFPRFLTKRRARLVLKQSQP